MPSEPAPTDETPAPSEPAPTNETSAPSEPAPTNETPAPSEPAPTGDTPVPTESAPTGEGTPAPSEATGETPVPTEPAPTAGTPTEYVPVVSAPVPTAGEEVVTTVVSCTFTDIGDNGLATKTLEVTKEIPASATQETYTVSMTESVTLCTVCGAEPTSVTLTVPASAPETTTPPAEEVTTSAPTEPSPGVPVTTELPSTPITDYAPVVSAPVPTEGEEVLTTIVSCTFTDIGDEGFTTKTLEVTKEIPAYASETTLSVSMTETVAVCTNCGAEPTTVTLTVPAQETPAEDATTTAGGAPETTAVDAVTSVPAVEVPTATAGEDVYTTVIQTTYVDVCPTGFTTKTVDVTKEIPATVTSTALTVIMTESCMFP